MAKRILPNETWVIVPVLCERKDNFGDRPVDHFVLKGYNSNTKEMLHEYGPFDTEAELHQFSREHTITFTQGK